MSDDSERLIVLLEARLTDFERNMLKASGISKKNFDQIKKNSGSATRQMEADMARSTARINQMLAGFSTKIGSYGKAFAGGLLAGGGVGLTALASQVGAVAKSIATVGDEAKRAGMSMKSFQEWKFVAEQNRIGIDALVDGFKELNLRADEFVLTGGGSAAEAFKRLGYGADDLKKKLQDPSALMLEIIGRLGKMEKAAQIRIADELFGGSAGERFVELIDQGEAGIRATIDRANELGIVMDDRLIQSAAELDRRFNEIANTVGSALKSAIVSAADSLAEFIDGFREFENQQNRTLHNKASDIDRERLDIENEILEVRQQQAGLSADEQRLMENDIKILEARRDALTETGARVEKILADRNTQAMQRSATREWTPPVSPPRGFGSSDKKKGGKSQMEKDADSYKKVVAAAQERIDQMKAEAIAASMTGEEATKLRMATDLLADAQKNGKKITAEQRAELEKLAEEYAKVAAEVQAARIQQDLLFERQQMFRSPTEQRVHETLRSAGIDIGSAQGEMIANQIRLNEQLAEGRDIAKEFASGLVSDLMNGVSAADALTNAAGRLADRLVQMAMDAVINQLFANLFGTLGGGGMPQTGGGAQAGGIGAAIASVVSQAIGGLNYANAAATRSMKLTESLEGKIKEAVGAVYGPGAYANVYSGGQPSIGSGGARVGSTRHDLGHAGDLYIFDSKGRQLTGDQLAPLAQYWQAKGYGGTGLEMRGGGIHLDEHTDRARFWDYSGQGGRITTAQRDAVAAGQQGILPAMSKQATAAGQKLEQLAEKSSAVGQGFDQVGTDLTQFGSNLANVFPSAPSSGGLSGIFKSIFGGGLSDSQIDWKAWGMKPTSALGFFANGGIANRPSIFGEAGPEAAVPLPDGRRIPVDLRGGGGGGSNVNVVVNNAPPGTQVREQTRQGPDGRELRNVVIDIVSSAVATGDMDPSFGGRYGARPIAARRGKI